MAEELRLGSQTPNRITRKVYQEDVDTSGSEKEHTRPSMFNFICMVMVAAVFDTFSLFLGEVPLVGAGIVLIADMVFIPWFYMSGMKFTNKRIIGMGIQTIAESIPLVGNFPIITINVIYSYYSS